MNILIASWAAALLLAPIFYLKFKLSLMATIISSGLIGLVIGAFFIADLYSAKLEKSLWGKVKSFGLFLGTVLYFVLSITVTYVLHFDLMVPWIVAVPFAAFSGLIIIGLLMPDSTSKTKSSQGGLGESRANSPVQSLYKAVNPSYSFIDVDGMEDTKQKLLRAGEEIQRSKSARNGILLHGDPGNGKTFFAEALAGQLRIPILSVSFGDMASMWVGEMTQKAMQIFDAAERQAPCMLFIDEIDSVFVDRSAVRNADSEAPKTLNAILKRLVDIRGKGVVVVAATNFIDKLDTAGIREGRFDYKVEVANPDFSARKALLKKGLEALEQSKSTGLVGKIFRHEPEVNPIQIDWQAVDRAAKRWEGYSVARIKGIVQATVELAIDRNIQRVTFDVLMDALRRVQSGKGHALPEDTPQLDELVLSDEMKARMNNIASRMSNIEVVEQFGGSLPAGVLFYGPPGTGKTLGVMALAKTTGWSFIRTSGQDMLADPDEVDRVVKKASDIRPCIVFIDEADDVLADRRMSPTSKAVTNKLIAVMDGAGGRPRDVVFVAATNNPDFIDGAALRGGRFTEKIEFNLPGDDVILEYVKKWIAGTRAPLSPEFTADAVAGRLCGQSLANTKEILQCAVNQAIGRISINSNSKVTLEDLLEAVSIVEGT